MFSGSENEKAIESYHKQWAEFEEKMVLACKVSLRTLMCLINCVGVEVSIFGGGACTIFERYDNKNYSS